MQKKRIALAIAGLVSSPALTRSQFAYVMVGNEGPADFLKPRPFGHNEKPWGKRNRRKLGGIKGAE